MAASGSPERLGQPDQDALGSADVAEPIAVLVLNNLANDLRPVGKQTLEHGVDVVDREHDATEAQRIHRRVL
jgi:hypothetical protein